MKTLITAGNSVKEIYEALVIDDIGRAADILKRSTTRPTV